MEAGGARRRTCTTTSNDLLSSRIESEIWINIRDEKGMQIRTCLCFIYVGLIPFRHICMYLCQQQRTFGLFCRAGELYAFTRSAYSRQLLRDTTSATRKKMESGYSPTCL
jgi:hypothetical protein